VPAALSARLRALALLSVLAVGDTPPGGAATALAEEPSAPKGASDHPAPAEPRVYQYVPKRHVPPSLEPVLRHLRPGNDAFPEEKDAQELAARLNEVSALLRESPRRARGAVDLLLAPEFKGGRLTPLDEVSLGSPSLEIFRAKTMPSELVRDRSTFGAELSVLVGEFETIQVAEFLITTIEVKPDRGPLVRTEVRYDIVGTGNEARRVERVGRWRMEWRRSGDGAWRVVEWTALDHLRSRALSHVFTEVTAAALGRNPSFYRQLVRGLDDWAKALDAAFTPGVMGHHGVSVGDADGDGLDDFYVSQPAGLPNRLFRNSGDGTFEDVTESAGLAVLDSTSESLFADVDNDRDQDLVLVTRTGLLLFVNDGRGHFTRVPDAFRIKGALRGSPTSMAMADYDRDGFLDIYLCSYSYFIGASEDKAGTPTPYHDAQNGPPNLLLRNDGHGRFEDVTDEVGLNQDNDRFSFAAAWADYDEDGWPDLLVANDFGRKNLYHNQGMVNGQVRFRDVAAGAGVEDYGAGMSATFLDYDNDGHLDIYMGNMWTAAGQRVTAQPGFMPDAPPQMREIYRRHARGNSLFRNRGDGTFEDVTLQARAEFGRWAWSSDALDFDNDGWEDLYIVNGMFTRDGGEEDVDLDSFFWRQLVARSPLTRVTGTAYDDAWRAINRRLMADAWQARHERNVLLRNNGRGSFDEVSGSVGLDVDEDGRSFAVFDYDGDGDPDLVLLAPRSSPQLHLFRNDLGSGSASLALRLVGTKSNRDGVGARVTVETDKLRRTRLVQVGSGFLSQHTKELLFGLGKSGRVSKVTVAWPSGATQTFSDVPINHRLWIQEGRVAVRSEPFRKPGAASAVTARAVPSGDASLSGGVWLYEPFPAPDFTLKSLDGQDRSLSDLAGRPVVLVFWATWAPPSVSALKDLAREHEALAAAGASILAVAVDPPADAEKVRAAAQGLGVPVIVASEEIAGTYSILNRYLFDRREDLRLPTVFLVSAQREIVKIYRDAVTAGRVLEDVSRIAVSPAARLARAVPFEGAFISGPGERNYFQYGLELSEQELDAPALVAFERVAKLHPTAITFYNLGTLYMKRGDPSRARAAFERALEMQPEYADASNSLGALLAQSGEVPAAIERFRAALQVKPDYPDALNNLGFALFQTGHREQAHELYEKALQLQPDFPEAYNNLGIFFGRQGDLEAAQRYFQQAMDKRAGYSEAANNLALVLSARGQREAAIDLLRRSLEEKPEFEMTYVTLSRMYLAAGQRREAVQVLERLLQRNPNHPLGLQVLREVKGGS
jgi:Tfp pilus assembly protein PilF/peroxiredoxin